MADTAGTVGVETAFTDLAATIADRFVTVLATAGTFRADGGIAKLAVIVFVSFGQIATVAAMHAEPVVQADERGIGVVSLQNLPHENEEIAEPPLSQCRLNRSVPLPFAEPIVLYMRMCCAVR